VAEREAGGPFRDPYDLWRRTGAGSGALGRLARADAFRSMGLDRRAALWAVEALGEAALPLFARLPDGARAPEPEIRLPEMPLGEHVVEDYASLSLSLKCHPLALLRDGLSLARIRPCADIARAPHGTRVTVAGLVLVRQRPGTAKGVVFVTLEDETGVANLVVFADLFERFRREVMTARLLAATGRVERVGEVVHLRAERLLDLSSRLADLGPDMRPADAIRPEPARADEVRHPPREPADPRGAFPKGRNFH
jgi:error-prone DNA polymerase